MHNKRNFGYIRKKKVVDDKVNIDAVYMLASFCKFYNYKFDEVMNVSSVIFFEMYAKTSIIQDERDLELLSITENKLWLKSENNENYTEIYKRKRDNLKRAAYEKPLSTIEQLKQLKKKVNK